MPNFCCRKRWTWCLTWRGARGVTARWSVNPRRPCNWPTASTACSPSVQPAWRNHTRYRRRNNMMYNFTCYDNIKIEQTGCFYLGQNKQRDILTFWVKTRLHCTLLAHLSMKCSWWAIVVSGCPSSSVVCHVSSVNIWCLHSRDHICNTIFMKLGQKVCFDNI